MRQLFSWDIIQIVVRQESLSFKNDRLREFSGVMSGIILSPKPSERIVVGNDGPPPQIRTRHVLFRGNENGHLVRPLDERKTMLDVRKWDAVLWKGHVEIVVAVRLDDAELRYPEITCGRDWLAGNR